MNEEEILTKIRIYRKFSCFQTSHFSKDISRKIYNIFIKNQRLIRGTFHMEMLIADINCRSEDPEIKTILSGTPNTLNETPSIIHMFKDIYADLVPMKQAYPLMFTQKISSIITAIYDKPLEFAQTTFEFFKNDSSHLLIFAYTTFPAIFGMFLGKEFCECGFNFLKNVLFLAKNYEKQLLADDVNSTGNNWAILNTKQLKKSFPKRICDCLLSSFFCAATRFYDCFWATLANKFTKFSSKSTFNHFFEATKSSLLTSLPYLSPYHVKAITEYSSSLPHKCINFFIERLILHPFLRESVSSVDFPSPIINSLFCSFLRELLTPIKFVYSEQLLNLVITKKEFISASLKMRKTKIWRRGIPIILNDNDIFIIYKMMSYSKLFNLNNQDDNTFEFSENFRPCTVDIFPNFLKIDKTTHKTDFIIDLFGGRPPKIIFSTNSSVQSTKKMKPLSKSQRKSLQLLIDDSVSVFPNNIKDLNEAPSGTETIIVQEQFPNNFPSLWRRFSALSKEKAGNAITLFYLNHLDHPIMNDTQFRKYVGLEILNEYSKNFDAIEETIHLFEYHTALKEINYLISRYNITLYHTVTIHFFKERIKSISDLAPTLKEFFNTSQILSSSSSSLFSQTESTSPLNTSKSYLPSSVAFELSCIAINCVNIGVSEKMKKADATFLSLLNEWMENEWPKQNASCHFNDKIKHVLDATTLLSQTPKMGIGMRLKIILQFQKRLHVILDEYWDQEWSILFHFAIYAANVPNIFETFLILHHFIFTMNDIVDVWGQNVHNTWGLFSTGMWYILKRNPDFCSYCSNINDCKELFVLK